jgi:hypothetical protein
MAREGNSLILEDARIIFRNFAGKEQKYNRAGDRNFAVLLDDRVAKSLVKDGWNVRVLPPREEGDPEQAYLQVAVNFNGPRPPRIVMVTESNKTTLHEDEVEILDWADIISCDMILRPYEWVVNGKSGIKAYLQSLYANIDEDPLERKYNNRGFEA